jgi:hypothetical protein
MAALRLLALVAVLAFALSGLALAQEPVDWYTDSGGGGVLAQPAPESRSGGALAPQTASGVEDVPESDISATPPVASAAQAEPVLGAEPPRSDRPAADAPAEPAQEAPTVTGGQEQEDTDEAGPIAALPLTGLQLAAVAAAGLCLLLAGALLRPRRTV